MCRAGSAGDPVEEEEENVSLILAFNNPNIDSETFEAMILDSSKSSKEFQKLKRRIAKITA